MASEVSGTAGAAGDPVAWWCWVIMSRVRPAAGPPEAGTGPPRSAGRSRSRTRSRRRGASLGFLVQARLDDRPQGRRHGVQRRLLVHHLYAVM
ncbi:hypothetical protein SCALM49S_09195 [Streptomyces californicus]